MRQVMAAVAVGVSVFAGCGPRQCEFEPAVEKLAPSTSLASSSSQSSTDTTQQPEPVPGNEGRDTKLVRDFIEFATAPSERTAAALRFGPVVRLGLGPDLIATVRESDISDAANWVLDVEYFRAYNGPFSALRPVATRVSEARDNPGSNASLFEVSVGEHPHCAGPPMEPPDGLQALRRVSLQPAGNSIDSCLSWFSVDLFLNQERSVVAVTLDIWEP